MLHCDDFCGSVSYTHLDVYKRQTNTLRYATDSELWQAFKEGDRAAFTQLYNLHIEDLLSYGYRVTSDRQLIKDSIQDLFLHLGRSRQNLADTCLLYTSSCV